jgi:H+/Cl- antiporter ClcA
MNYILEEGIYALIGAAATVGAATKTIAPAIIVFEITGQSSHMVPVLLGVLLANCVANNLAMSVFDVILDFKNLPYLPTLGSASIYT